MVHNTLRLTFFCLILLLLSTATGSTQSNGRLISEGDTYFDAGRFRNALQYYLQGGNMETWNKSTKLQVAICQYAINDVDSAIRTLNRLVAEGKTDKDVFFYLARSYQQRNQFQEAIDHYKQFIKKTNAGDGRVPWVKDEILRCAVGKSLKHGEETAYVENLGARVNGFYDEYGPVPSPNFQARIYLSSAREDSDGGFVTGKGNTDTKLGHPLSDIYFTALENGSWTILEKLDSPINSNDAEHLLAFGQSGQALIFRRGPESGGELLVDSFSVENQVYRSDMVEINTIDPNIRDLYFFNDTILIRRQMAGTCQSRPGCQ